MKLQAFFNSFVGSASDNVSLLIYAAVNCAVCAIVRRFCKARGINNKFLNYLPFIVGVLIAALDAIFGNLVPSIEAILNVVADGLTIGAVATAMFGVKQGAANVPVDAKNATDVVLDSERLARLIRRLADLCSGDTDAASATIADVITSVLDVCATSDEATKLERLTELLTSVLGEDAADLAEGLMSVLSG